MRFNVWVGKKPFFFNFWIEIEKENTSFELLPAFCKNFFQKWLHELFKSVVHTTIIDLIPLELLAQNSK